MKVSIVIRAYNEGKHLEKLLLGIGAQTLQPHETILVDSGSTDNTVEIARRFGVQVVPIEKSEFTFGRSLNMGCEAATGDICVFPSAHVYPVYEDWLEKIVAPFHDDRVVISYGRQIGNELNKFSEHQIFAKWFPDHSVCPQKTYFCNNANCAVRRSEWLENPYDESLTGLEDLAWAKQAQARGGWIAYVGDATIVHVHEETWGQVRNRYRREAIAMRVIDEHARFSRIDLVKLLGRTMLSDFRAAWRQRKLLKEFGSIVLFRYNQLSGTYRGYNDRPEITAELRKRFYYPQRKRDMKTGEDTDRARALDYDRLRTEASHERDRLNYAIDTSNDTAEPAKTKDVPHRLIH